MTSTRTLLLICAVSPVFAQTTVTYNYNGLPLPILTSNANTTTIANIFVPNSIKMTQVTTSLDIEYPNAGDLQVYLFSPAGTRTILTQNNCSGLANINTTFSDSGTTMWSSFCPAEPARGPFLANQPLANFNNDASSFGVWQLTVRNNQSNSRAGWIASVSVTITGTSLTAPVAIPATITNAANLGGAGTIAPGELVSIYGIGLGPNPGVSAPSGSLPTSLSGTSVTISGAPVPIAYASAEQIICQIPFNLTVGANVPMQITVNGSTSSTVSLPVVSAVPGIYAQSLTGVGQIMATNADGTANSSTDGAAPGSVITLYATGLGVVSPAIAAGTAPPTSPLSLVTGVTAILGGVPATVEFAGLAPGLPGLYQLNIQIPATAPAGAAQLLIFVSGQASQSGAVLQVQ